MVRSTFCFSRFLGSVGLVAFVVSGVAIPMGVSGCAASAEPADVVVHMDDLQSDGRREFSSRTLVSTEELTDVEAMSLADVDRFLARTPYKFPSFLATFESNGVKASKAIVDAATKYRLNPLVFLVYAQVSGALISERYYPYPPGRVVNLFGCGCTSGGCARELEGFDRQVDCLGKSLRASLDAIAAGGATASGWAPDVTRKTTDGATVTPTNEATAALYEQTPTLGKNAAHGVWLFWNLWEKYSTFLGKREVGEVDP